MRSSQWFVFAIVFFVLFLGCFGLYFMWSPSQTMEKLLMPGEDPTLYYASLDLSSNIASLFGFIFFFLCMGFLFCGFIEANYEKRGRKK